MAGNSFGKLLRLTTFGESHGPAIGGVLDGFPAGVEIDLQFIADTMARRKPGQSAITTSRTEDDEVHILSGVFEGKSTGTPLAFLIWNKDQNSSDYTQIKDIYRPGHADFVYDQKYGFRDYRGGGRSSARETAVRVAAGAFATMLLKKHNVEVKAFVSAVKHIQLEKTWQELDLSKIDQSLVRCPDEAISSQMEKCIAEAAEARDSVGGVITCVCNGMETGLGEPVFDKLNAVLAHALFSINAVKGVEIDGGFESTTLYGSQNNPLAEGITGGISNGKTIVIRIGFKPVSSIGKEQLAKDVQGNEQTLTIEGRHDPCVLPRAVPIVEAMTTLVLADFLLLRRSDKV